MYKIEKNISIPKSIHGGGAPNKYPFENMEIGDSFLIPCLKKDKQRIQSAVSASMKRVPRMKFTTKYVVTGTDVIITGVRVWRIS